jgi:hypothetical protein
MSWTKNAWLRFLKKFGSLPGNAGTDKKENFKINAGFQQAIILIATESRPL